MYGLCRPAKYAEATKYRTIASSLTFGPTIEKENLLAKMDTKISLNNSRPSKTSVCDGYALAVSQRLANNMDYDSIMLK